MNLTNIIAMCHEIARDYKGMDRIPNENDTIILSVIMRFYLTDRYLDWEEVEWLWIEYLETGNLYLGEARGKAEQRIARKELADIIATEDELLRWLRKGI